MPHVYHRDQTGSPALSFSTVPGDISHFVSFKAILKACLVSGYDVRPAAGWELISEGTNYLVLRNGAHSGYVGFVFSAGGVVTVYVLETYTGQSGDIPQGDGQKTGIDVGNSVPQRFSVYYSAYSSAACTWTVIADERTCLINMSSNNSNSPWVPATNGSVYINFILYVGEDTGANFIAVGGRNTTSVTAESGSIDNTFNRAGFTALRNPGTGLLVDTGSIVVSTPGMAEGIRRGTWEEYVVPKVWLGKVQWFGGSAWAGYFRGLVAPGNFTTHLAGSVAKVLGFPGEFNTRTANTPIDLGDGYLYFSPIFSPVSSAVLFTNNPEYW